jgi:hypothetical protein
VYSAAQTVTSSISTVASSASAWLTSQLGPASPSTIESLNAISNAYDAATAGVAAGVTEVKGATTETVGDVVQNEFGSEARNVGGKISESIGNVGGTAGQITEFGSGAPIAVAAARGVVSAENTMHEELGTFKIQEREESGEWKDVPV